MATNIPPRDAQAPAAASSFSSTTMPPRVYASDRPGKTKHERVSENLPIIASCLDRARWRWLRCSDRMRVQELAEVRTAMMVAHQAWRSAGNAMISVDEAAEVIARCATVATQIDSSYDTTTEEVEDGL